MARDPHQNPLRLRKKHAPGAAAETTAADGARLLAAQSMRNALVAGLIATLLFSILWIAVTSLTNRILPWFTVLLGYMVGFAVQQAGRGVDWRFPTLAAVLASGGALFANIVVAASVTADEFGTGTLHILRSVTRLTWSVFFSEVLSVADAVFALSAAAVAAFFASRRLTRTENFALRLWKEQHDDV